MLGRTQGGESCLFEGWSKAKNSERWGWGVQEEVRQRRVEEHGGRRGTDFIDIAKEVWWYRDGSERDVYFEPSRRPGSRGKKQLLKAGAARHQGARALGHQCSRGQESRLG